MKIAIVGAGHIGRHIAALLVKTGDYTVTIFDNDHKNLSLIDDPYGRITPKNLNILNEAEACASIRGHDIMINALPFHAATRAADIALLTGCHYFDLTEDIFATKHIQKIAQGASVAFMPQCGLAPGFIGIAAHHLCKKFDTIYDVKMRVGALPTFPTNALKYNLTWSVDGLINEYCNPCEAIKGGASVQVQPLEGLEHFLVDGVEYEAFNTSGGLGTLCETLQGQIHNMDYKTIRYPGHRDIMKLLLQDLRLSSDQDNIKGILKRAIPTTTADLVIVFISVSGLINGKFVEEIFHRKIFADDCTAIQATTASGICAAVDLFVQGKLPQTGFIRQEDVDLDQFCANRFGKVYDGNLFYDHG